MHIWKPAALGFAARVSPVSPWNRVWPVHSREKSPSRGVASLDPRSSPRGRAEERRRRRLISSDDLATASFPPPAYLQQPRCSHQVVPIPSPPLTTHLPTPSRVSPLLSSHLFLVDPVEAEQDPDVVQ